MNMTCNDSALLSVIAMVKNILNILTLAIPIVLILMLSIDISKLVIDPNDSNRAKILKSIVNKAIATVVVFFLPTIVNMFMGAVGTDNFQKASCWKEATTENIEVLRQREKAVQEEEKAKRTREKEEQKLKREEETREIERKREIAEVKAKEEARKKELEEARKRQALGYDYSLLDSGYFGRVERGPDGIYEFYQAEAPWRSHFFGNYSNSGIEIGSQTIAGSGCGPTTMAVILASFYDNPQRYNPITVTKSACAKYDCSAGMTSMAQMSQYLNEQGLVSYYGGRTNARKLLQDLSVPGTMILAWENPGSAGTWCYPHFTTGGHYYAIVGLKNGLLDVVQVGNRKQTGLYTAESRARCMAGYYVVRR